MGNFLHRTNKQYLTSISPASLPEAVANYIEEPDLTAVQGFESRYWTITDDVVTLMSQGERDSVDAAQLAVSRDACADRLVDVEDVLRAFALVVLDEINNLRVNQHGLAARTIAQLKTSVRGKLGT